MLCSHEPVHTPSASAPQELTHKGCGDASMRKRRAQATSLKHSERESGNQNKGKLSNPWGDLCVRGNVCLKNKTTEIALKMRIIPQDDHITPQMNEAFVTPWDPSAYGRTHGW